MTTWVLMYHRVCPRTPATEPWFVRETAVTPSAFAAQLEWVQQRFDVVDLTDLLEGPHQPAGRPRVAITFDDGYGEVLHTVAPICLRRGIRATCFVPAEPVMTGDPLWFDALYGAAASRAPELGALVRSWGFDPPRDHAGWVMGPVKRWLADLEPRDLQARTRELGALWPDALRAGFYLSLDDLGELASLGWSIGGHGRTHVRLPGCDESTLEAELSASRTLVDRVGGRGARCFAYADGAWDQRVSRRVASAGFQLACTVQRGSFEVGTHLLEVPRLFCRGESALPHALLAGMD